MEQDDGDTNCIWSALNDPRRLGKGVWGSKKSEDDPKQSKLRHFLEESWKAEKTCSYSDYSKRSSASADVENSPILW